MNPLLIIKFFHSNFKIKLIYFCAMIGIGHWLGQWLVNGNNMNDIRHYSIECDSGLTRQIFHYFCDSTRLDSRSGDSWLDSTRALVPVTRDSTRTRPSWLVTRLGTRSKWLVNSSEYRGCIYFAVAVAAWNNFLLKNVAKFHYSLKV